MQYYNKVEICGINTNELKLLKEPEKIELLKKAKTGDQKARDKLINGNLRLFFLSFNALQTEAREWTICFRSVLSV